MTTEQRLRECPFCGASAELQTDGQQGYWIECTNAACGSSTNMRIALMDDVKEMLIEQWNRRAPSQAQDTPSLPEAAAWLVEQYCPPLGAAWEGKWTTAALTENPTGWDGFRNPRPLYTAPPSLPVPTAEQQSSAEPSKLQEQAEAWCAVFEALQRVCPNWIQADKSGIQSAVEAIERLAAHPPAEAPKEPTVPKVPKGKS